MEGLGTGGRKTAAPDKIGAAVMTDDDFGEDQPALRIRKIWSEERSLAARADTVSKKRSACSSRRMGSMLAALRSFRA